MNRSSAGEDIEGDFPGRRTEIWRNKPRVHCLQLYLVLLVPRGEQGLGGDGGGWGQTPEDTHHYHPPKDQPLIWVRSLFPSGDAFSQLTYDSPWKTAPIAIPEKNCRHQTFLKQCSDTTRKAHSNDSSVDTAITLKAV